MTYTREEILEHRKAWAEALESGEYTQTSGRLAYSESDYDAFMEHLAHEGIKLAESPVPVGHCCLGVACEVALEAGVINEYDRDAGTPPREVAEYFGFAGGHCEEDYLGETTIFRGEDIDVEDRWASTPPAPVSLAGLNDEEELTFAEIAEIVRDEALLPIAESA